MRFDALRARWWLLVFVLDYYAGVVEVRFNRSTRKAAGYVYVGTDNWNISSGRTELCKTWCLPSVPADEQFFGHVKRGVAR